MTLTARIRDWLTEPLVRNTDADSTESTFAHREILRRKVLLRTLFERFYHDCRNQDSRYFEGSRGVRFEIGSGSSFLKEVFPDVLTSDVKTLPFVDVVTRAEALPMRTESVRAVYGINVFHHLPDPRLFFEELDRVLVRGGGAVLIEPYHGPVARVVFRHLHTTESFDTTSSSWRRSDGGPMSNANQALSYLVFKRDRKDFERDFPRLELVHQRPHTHLMYGLSGGVNFRQLVPDRFAPGVLALERVLSPFDRILALQQTLVLRKKL